MERFALTHLTSLDFLKFAYIRLMLEVYIDVIKYLHQLVPVEIGTAPFLWNFPRLQVSNHIIDAPYYQYTGFSF